MFGSYRHELKYVVKHDDKAFLLERWRRHLVKDPYANEFATTPVLSQYYDSPDFAFYRDKYDGLVVRNKVRLRTYSHSFKAGAACFLEIKQKKYDLIRKIRMPLPGFSCDCLEPGNWNFPESKENSVLETLKERYLLRKSAQVWYLREAYYSIIEPDVRVTFDSSVTALYPGEDLTRTAVVEQRGSVMPDSYMILEVKATERIPAWVSKGVMAGELVQKPVPKYVLAMDKLRMSEFITGAYL